MTGCTLVNGTNAEVSATNILVNNVTLYAFLRNVITHSIYRDTVFYSKSLYLNKVDMLSVNATVLVETGM